MKYKKKLTDLKFHIFFLLLFVYFISSINAPIFNPISSPSFKFTNIFEFINIARSISPLITFTILIFFFIYRLYKKNIFISKINYLLLFYLIIQVPFLYLIPIKNIIPGIYNNNFQDMYWVISGICAICFFIIFENNNNELGKNCMFIFWLILCIVTCVFMGHILKLFYYDNMLHNFEFKAFYYGNVASDPNTKMLSTAVPRTSGLSRNLMAFFIVSLIIYLYYEGKKKIANIKFKKYLFCVLVILLFFLFNLQSRSTFLFLITFSIILVFNYDNLNSFKKLIKMLVIFLIALFIHKNEPDLRLKITKHFKDKNIQKLVTLNKKTTILKSNYKEDAFLLVNSIKDYEKKLIPYYKNIKNLKKEEMAVVNNIQLKIDNINKRIKEIEIIYKDEIFKIYNTYESYSLKKIKKHLGNLKGSTLVDKKKLIKHYGLSEEIVDQVLEKFSYKNFVYNDENGLSPLKVIKKQEINEINEINEIRAKEVKIIATNKSVAVINTTRKINFHDSGRFYLWGQAIKLIKANNYIYGYGPQADRKYIGENVSNTYLYMYLTAGIFGIISLFVIAAIHVYMLFYNIFIFKIFKQRHNSIEKISIFLILFIYSRTIFENTFAVFSIDMLIFLFANYYINAYYQKNKKLIELN